MCSESRQPFFAGRLQGRYVVNSKQEQEDLARRSFARNEEEEEEEERRQKTAYIRLWVR
jgi:hypothetical protein